MSIAEYHQGNKYDFVEAYLFIVVVIVVPMFVVRACHINT